MPPLSLEDFSETLRPEPVVLPPEGDPQEEIRQAAYEEGYGAGWEDAITAQNDARAEREAEVARHLQTLAFGYHEARHHMLAALEPLLREIAASILPSMARPLLAAQIAESFIPLAQGLVDAPVRLRISPLCRGTVERLLPASAQDVPFLIIEDSALGEGQAMIDSGRSEILVDLDACIAAISGLISDFYQIQQTERAYAG